MISIFNQETGFLKDQREKWENALKVELKLTDLKGRLDKKNLDVGVSPVLSLDASPILIPCKTNWKKAAQTYLSYPTSFEEWLQEDLDQGVRCFFFGGQNFSEKHSEIILKVFQSASHPEEIEFYHLNGVLAGHEVHNAGGNAIQELALTTIRLIESEGDKPQVILGAYMDSRFFANMAKLRALRLLSTKVIQERGSNQKIKIIGLNSYRDWTIYDRYSNILRNNIQVASALIGGADCVQSSGYETLFELSGHTSSEHMMRSRRIARNTSHVLALESMLGIVEDAAYGSYHLESMTQNLAKKSWELMQKILPLGKLERERTFNHEVQKIKEQRIQQFNTRKTVLAGINDFALLDEKIQLEKDVQFPFYRLAGEWENLRLKVEKIKVRPEVIIKLKGDYSLLSARINYIKNYFETIGLKIHDPLDKNIPQSNGNILVLCASDSDYPNWSLEFDSVDAQQKFVAGKVEIPGFTSIYVGQNVFETLAKMVEGWKV